MILVSAIYSHGINSIIGGRGRNIDFYFSSLRNIANFNVPFVLYTEPENVKKSEVLLSPYFKHLKVIPYELSSFLYYDRFINWKKDNIDFSTYLNDRNEILCYSKPYWVKDTIEKEYFKELNISNQYLWIDSGLTHHGIFPEKVGGLELLIKYDDKYYYPNNPQNMFSPKFSTKLSSYITSLNRLFFCSLPWQGDCRNIIKTLLTNNLITDGDLYIKEHLIGGIFGGDKDLFLQFFQKYESMLKLFLDSNIHVLEEQIFSTLNYLDPSLLHREFFDTWWFYSPGEPNSFLSSEQNSFYKVFTKIFNS
jgi:hypothetical protein